MTPDVFRPQRYVIISLHLHIHTRTFMRMARVLFAKEKNSQSIIFEGFRNCFVLQAPSQSPCIPLGHNLNHPSLECEVNRCTLDFRY